MKPVKQMQIMGTMTRTASESGVRILCACHTSETILLYFLKSQIKNTFHFFLSYIIILLLQWIVLFLTIYKLTEPFQKDLHR